MLKEISLKEISFCLFTLPGTRKSTHLDQPSLNQIMDFCQEYSGEMSWQGAGVNSIEAARAVERGAPWYLSLLNQTFH